MRLGDFGLVALAILALGCSSGPAATPIVIYVTPPPGTAPASSVPTAAPTPIVPAATPTLAVHDVTVQVDAKAPAFSMLSGLGYEILSYPPTECGGTGDYSDLDQGMRATIKDGSGNILGIAAFDGHGKSITMDGNFTTDCQFTSVAKAVPDAAFYQVSLGQRDPQQFTHDELRAHNYVIALSVGSSSY